MQHAAAAAKATYSWNWDKCEMIYDELCAQAKIYDNINIISADYNARNNLAKNSTINNPNTTDTADSNTILIKRTNPIIINNNSNVSIKQKNHNELKQNQ